MYYFLTPLIAAAATATDVAGPPTSGDFPVDRITAAIIAFGSVTYAVIQYVQKDKGRKALTQPAITATTCGCDKEIREAELRIKQHVDALQVDLEAKLEATHKHAGLLPLINERLAVIIDRGKR